MTLSNVNIENFQPQAWKVLSRSFQSEKLAGTYLFSGPDGCGRWALAISLAMLINCEQPELDKITDILRPCGECGQCRKIAGFNFEGLYVAAPLPPHKNADEAIDLTNQFLDLKKEEPFAILSSTSNLTIPIDVARGIKKRLHTRAQAGMRRVVIFYQMEKMKEASADALLKLIEEPPADVVVILITEKPERLLPTIQSRSQRINLKRITLKITAEYLKEKYSIPSSKADLLARISQGIPGQAISMLESQEENSSLRRGVGFQLFKSLIEDRSPQVIARLTDIIGARNRGDAEELLRLWQSFIRDCSGLAVSNDENGLTHIDMKAELARLAVYFSARQLGGNMTRYIKIALADLRRNVHIHGALVALVLRIKSELMTSM
ncbi:MAG: hypothetical protein ABIJ12_13585 [bacterium]